MDDVLRSVFDGILSGNQEDVRVNVQLALDNGIKARKILDDGLISAMDEVGVLFEKNEFFVPEMLISARAMKAGLEILRPELINDDVEATGSVVIGTVQGDLHDIGKNLVAIMLEGAGFEVIDLGVDQKPQDFVNTIQQSNATVVALSALLTTTMSNMKITIEKIQEAGLADRVKVIVGGAPVTQEFADEIGADGFAADASLAVKLVKTLLA